MVLELSDGDLVEDKRTLFQATQKAEEAFTYHFMRAPQEPILRVADGVAWAWSRGGTWHNSIGRLITQVKRP